MPAITGDQYIKRIDQLHSEVWLDGEQITGNISEHPNFKGIMKSQASLYDLQLDPSLKDVMTYPSPVTGERVGVSFLQPKSKEDLAKRRETAQHWARLTNGFMGRSPDYMNTAVAAFASSAGFLKGKENCFSENLEAYYEYIRDNDLSLTHTFIDPQVNRSKYYVELIDDPIAACVVGENEEGIIIKGAKLLATQGGITDELFVMSASWNGDERNGFCFALPSNTKGVKFICRESFVGGDSQFNYPLSARFEEMDAMVVFDNVVVPWNRVFYYNNIEVSNTFVNNSAFQSFTLHQVVARQIIKTEFILGVALAIIETINISEHQHVHDKVSEIIVTLETMKALLLKSEDEAKEDDYGFMRPDSTTLLVAINIYPKIYPRFTEIIQLLGASGLINIPTENAFQSELRADLDQYLQSKGHNAEDRVKIFRLAWDITMSSFGTRHTLYERFFFGDPVKLSSQLYTSYNKEPHLLKVKKFLNLE